MTETASREEQLARKEMLHRFPSLVPVSADFGEFRGRLVLCGRNIDIRLRCSKQPHPQVIVTSSDHFFQSLLEKLKTESPELVDKIRCMSQPANHLHELLSALERVSKLIDCTAKITSADTTHQKVSSAGAKAFRQLLEQLNASIGTEHLKDVDGNSVILNYRDMEMKYDVMEGRIVGTTLPQEIFARNSQLGRLRSLTEAFAAFKDLVIKLEPFYESFKTLDATAWIIDPSDLKRPYRRVALEGSIALQITFTDPLQPGRPPLLELLGCPSSGRGLREILRCADWTRRWDARRDVLANLREVLGDDLKLLSRDFNSEVDLTCAICYAYHLGEQIPDVFCSHESCRRSYHTECFRAWALQWCSEQGAARLQTAATGASFAPCVYCEQPIAANSISS